MIQKTAYHPRRRLNGAPVEILTPHVPTPLSAWADGDALATVVPDGAMPEVVCVCRVLSVSLDEGCWEALAATGPGFKEPPFHSGGLRAAAGVVIEESDGRVWLVSPTNRFAGYDNTFPKGGIDGDMSFRASAIREAWEESGLLVELTGHLIDCQRSKTTTRYYRAVRIAGDPAKMGWESQAVHLVPRARLAEFLTNIHDAPVLRALLDVD